MGQVIELPQVDTVLACVCGSESFRITSDMCKLYCANCDEYYILDETIETELECDE